MAMGILEHERLMRMRKTELIEMIDELRQHASSMAQVQATTRNEMEHFRARLSETVDELRVSEAKREWARKEASLQIASLERVREALIDELREQCRVGIGLKVKLAELEDGKGQS